MVPGELSHLVGRIDRAGYRQFTIRVGSKKRAICAPRDWLMDAQRSALDEIFRWFDVPQCVYGVRGRDVVANARQHLDRQYMVALDIRDCFPCVRVLAVRRGLHRLGFDRGAVALLTKLVTYHGQLPQGPPTSPAILNIVFAPLDHELNELAAQYGGVYTRYIDDLCFSSHFSLDGLVGKAVRVLRRSGFSVNRQKYRNWGPTDPHTVTKIVVASSLQPTREYLLALTRELARLKRGESGMSVDALRGRIAWVRRLDAELGASLNDTLRLLESSADRSRRGKPLKRNRI
jgi:hypothetical protein